ncbi:hypothetical protein ILYODFUR_026064 [Ilyodon furcidens]|uniref:Uncharacterized protein n=1 Tax=Ilyodon furcidens TaxID=33524 RepID=A0ABV0T2I2_9TELE
MRSLVTKSQARQLLHNKFVVILGGSVQRSMYKDLVVLLQRDQHLTLSQLKSKVNLSPPLSLQQNDKISPAVTPNKQGVSYASHINLRLRYHLPKIL